MDKQPAAIESVNASVSAILFKRYIFWSIAYVLVAIWLFIGTFATGTGNGFIFFIWIFLGVGVYGMVQRRVKTAFTQQFGKSIGFSYATTADMSEVSGQLFSQGFLQSIYDVLSGVYRNRPSRIYSYKFTVQRGKNTITYYFTVFEVTWNGVMKDIALQSIGSFDPVSISGESLQLEGDFNKYFHLVVPKGYEQEAYQIFTPDVMATLEDKAHGLNFEFNGSKLYIYVARLVKTRAELQSMLDLSQYLEDLFSHNVAETVEPTSAIESRS